MDVHAGRQLDDKTISDLVLQAKDYLATHGLLIRTEQDPTNPHIAAVIPTTLLPSPVPENLFYQAHALQKDINLLMHCVSHDYQFLKSSLKNVVNSDDFTWHLWQIYETVMNEGVTQPCTLAINRSDYMFEYIDTTSGKENKDQHDFKATRLRQIEVNTVSVGGGGFSHIENYHRYMLSTIDEHDKQTMIPSNNSLGITVNGLIQAWNIYNNPRAVILFVVYDDERNVYGQRIIEYGISKTNSHIKCIRRSLMELHHPCKLSHEKKLIIDGMEVAIIYFRSMYMPADFTDEKDWDVRLLLERSQAIKCPSIGNQLAGTKTVQQVMAQPGVVEKFIQDPEAVARIRETFAAQYSLDLDDDGDNAVAMAMNKPEQFVLKPQREGGGNNIFGEDICRLLSEIKDSEQRTAYTLMELIQPIRVQNYLMLKNNDVRLVDCVSELGVYGTFIGSKDQVLLNQSGGHILRTKIEGVNEGGAISGFSCMDSPLLVEL